MQHGQDNFHNDLEQEEIDNEANSLYSGDFSANNRAESEEYENIERKKLLDQESMAVHNFDSTAQNTRQLSTLVEKANELEEEKVENEQDEEAVAKVGDKEEQKEEEVIEEKKEEAEVDEAQAVPEVLVEEEKEEENPEDKDDKKEDEDEVEVEAEVEAETKAEAEEVE